jgi:hypothetical protein
MERSFRHRRFRKKIDNAAARNVLSNYMEEGGDCYDCLLNSKQYISLIDWL